MPFLLGLVCVCFGHACLPGVFRRRFSCSYAVADRCDHSSDPAARNRFPGACRRVCFSLRYLSARVSRSLACCSVPGWFPFPIAGYAVCLETSEEYDLRTAFVASPSVLAVPALLLAQQNPSASGFLKRFVFCQQFPFPYRSIAVKRVLVLSLIVLFPVSARAQERTPNAEVSEKKETSAATSVASTEETRIKALEEQVSSLAEQVALLRGELSALRDAKSAGPRPADHVLLASSRLEPGTLPATSASPAVPAGPEPASSPAPPQYAQTQTYGGATSNAKLLNPDISLIGDFIGTAGHNTVSPSPSLELHESEVGMQAIIDPYARGDAFLSFGEQGVNVEEGYITFTSLPAGLLLKVGKMRAEFGRLNTIHNHALPFIDRPLATNNLVGGEDGIDDAGISLSRFLPAPKNWFFQGTAQVYRGDSDEVFSANRRQDVSVVGHLRLYRDLGESTNIDLGGSYARGHNNAGVQSGRLPHQSLQRRRHVALEAAAPGHLPFFPSTQRVFLERPRSTLSSPGF